MPFLINRKYNNSLLQLVKRIQKSSSHQQDYHSRIKMMRQIQAEETKRMKEDLREEKLLKTALTKQQSDLIQLQHKKKMEEELQDKQSQFTKVSNQIHYEKIQEWEFQMKQELEQKKIDKIEKIRQEQQQFKAQLFNKLDQTSKAQQKLMEEEQQLLRKLQNSQQKGAALRQDLSQALNVSIKDYHNQSIAISSSQKSYSQQKLTKQQLESPYAQIPFILKMKIPKEQQMREIENIFPSLVKPTFLEQQKYVERLCKTKEAIVQLSGKIKEQQLPSSQGSHMKFTTSSKFDTSKTYQNKFVTGTQTTQLKLSSTQPREQDNIQQLMTQYSQNQQTKTNNKKQDQEKDEEKQEKMKQSKRQLMQSEKQEQEQKAIQNEEEEYQGDSNYEDNYEQEQQEENEKEQQKKNDELPEQRQNEQEQLLEKEESQHQEQVNENDKENEDEEYPPDD